MDIDELLTRGVAETIVKENLAKKLESGKKLRIKFGVDPTRPDIHLGHAVVLWKLKALQEDGHTIIFLIGDYTTKIGDPSGRNSTRPILTDDEIKANAKTYFEQVGKILDVSKTEVRYNSEWFEKMSFADILKIAGKFTVAQIIERDDFAKRLKDGSDIGLHEILYPIMQAYDSVELKADVEFGGMDQKFNILAGRELQKKMDQPVQDVVLMDLLVGTDGKIKMSKSVGNYIGITEEPNEIFGKVMSIPDELIKNYFQLCTPLNDGEITKILEQENPRDQKMRLAKEIVALYHNEIDAEDAEEEFVKVFSNKEMPSEVREYKIDSLSLEEKLIDLLVNTCQLTESRSEARRLIEQGGVKVNGEKIVEPEKIIRIEESVLLQVGPRNFMKIIK